MSKPVANNNCLKGGVLCSKDSFVVKERLYLRMNISAEFPTLHKSETIKQKLKNIMKKISIACLISGMLSVLVGVAVKNSAGSHSLLIMGLLLEAIALAFFLIILFRK
jgi:hypothetical protein